MEKISFGVGLLPQITIFFLSRVLTCLLCRKRAEMSSQSYFEKSILTNMIIVLESVK